VGQCGRARRKGPEKRAGMLRKSLCSRAVTPLSLIVTVSGHGNKFKLCAERILPFVKFYEILPQVPRFSPPPNDGNLRQVATINFAPNAL
jgi:hypothetical protein